MKFSINEPPREKIFKWECSSSEYIPYKCFWNSNTVLLKDNSMVRVIKVRGFAFETADDEDIDIKKIARNNLMKGMASGNLAIWFHTIRRRREAFPEGEMTNVFTKKLNEEWRERFDGSRCFINEHYITIIRKEDSGGLAAIASLAKKLRNKADSSAAGRDMKESFSELEEISGRVLNGLSNYAPELLDVVETNNGIFSEICSFLGTIINCGYTQNYRFVPYDLDKYLSVNRLYFGSKNFEVRFPFETKYGGMVSLKEYRPSTNAGMLDGFLQLPFEFIITQSFQFVNRMVAISSMQLQQRRMIQAEDVAVSQIQEIDEALDSAMSGTFAFGKHHMTVMCLDDSIKGVENALSMVVVELSNVGIMAVREKMNIKFL